jgi:hypothetical protein
VELKEPRKHREFIAYVEGMKALDEALHTGGDVSQQVVNVVLLWKWYICWDVTCGLKITVFIINFIAIV